MHTMGIRKVAIETWSTSGFSETDSLQALRWIGSRTWFLYHASCFDSRELERQTPSHCRTTQEITVVDFVQCQVFVDSVMYWSFVFFRGEGCGSNRQSKTPPGLGRWCQICTRSGMELS
ncbi:hypothetical protein MPTK1_4g11610 [Marchantia polymorpha subsp. ruderalis]|uniref:Uncharacterized protein n=2 Tax=Marchantia polymorpha TaxID=3197 RepID=A0AAF6B8V7_MARPO|nr:hypothetical protein MARPO_0011s0146 [Marchantia polymorpha]BBN08441.1 hypothetical protein Mp_4g11610 [Marchantia polymorpha subsp. ruderalis]|eukprot:PTQ46477.1 hypothetical protein MARPO_0011s0146 [Marchantia polymorpha]